MDFAKLAKHVRDSERIQFPFGMTVQTAAGVWISVDQIHGPGAHRGRAHAGDLSSRLARRMRDGGPPKGLFPNFFEVLLVFIRDEVARPSIGKHDADKFLPLWKHVLFHLVLQLVGHFAVGRFAHRCADGYCRTGGDHACAVVGTGMQRFGVGGFFKSLVPHMDLPKPIAIVLVPMIFVIELVGLLIRHVVLAVRLLANMFAGHLVLAVILGFIAATANHFFLAWLGITTASVLGSAALTLLELFVAFLQANIFTFLSALFIGMAVHPH